MVRIRFLMVAFLPLLASCALGPKPLKPDLRLPAAYEAPRDVTQPGVDIDHWWTAYDDPQLEALINQALAGAPDARSAGARLREALAVRSSALDPYNPQGNLQGSAQEQTTKTIGKAPVIGVGNNTSIPLTNNGTFASESAQFNVSWELDIFGRRVAARHKADADLAAARFDYEATRISLAANVADQLFQARGLAIQLADARETSRIEQDLADVARKKADHGLGSVADADQAAAQAAQSQAQVDDLQSQLHAARRTLLVLVGKGADPLDTLPAAPEAAVPPPVPASVPGELLARRPDVREAAQQLRSATGQYNLNELAFFPKFTLQPGLGLSSVPEFGTNVVSDAWTIGLGVAQPILNIHTLEADVRAQGARVDQAAIAYEKAVQSAYGDSENALVELSSDEARVTLLTTGEAQARAAYDAARKRYAAGLDDLTSVLSAEQTWRGAHSALTSARVQALRRSVQAFKALGGGWTPTAPIEPVASR